MTSAATPAVPRKAIITALVLMVGGLAVIFDSTIVSLALKTLAQELDVPVSTIQWVSTAYLLALGVTIPVVGWAQARIGGKRLWMIALTIFLVASIACSLAWSAPSLIAFRVLQGVGGGLMMPLMATLAIQQVPRGVGLGRLMAVVSLPAALGPILGPTIGGLILNSLDWRWLFWVNVPFCLVGLVLAWRILPKDPPTGRPKLDLVGLLLISPALVGILYGLTNVSQDGGFSRPDVWAPDRSGRRPVRRIRARRDATPRHRPRRHPPAEAPAGGIVVGRAVPLGRVAVRFDAPPAAVLPDRPGPRRADRGAGAHPAGSRRAAQPHARGQAHRLARRPGRRDRRDSP